MNILMLDKWEEDNIALLGRANKGNDDKGIELIIANLQVKLDKEEIDKYPDLKLIATCTTGLDHIDIEYCKAKGIEVISLKGAPMLENIHATAEHTIAIILALIRKIPYAHKYTLVAGFDRELWQGTELYGKTLGIIGYGRVGKQVGKIAEAFGMRIETYDIKGGTCESIYDLLMKSDIVSVHVDLNETTTNMISDNEFMLMRPTAYLINTSRGKVIDEKALYKALINKYIAGAAIDVMADEANPSRELLTYARYADNLVVTPHIAGNSQESRYETQKYIAERIIEHQKECRE